MRLFIFLAIVSVAYGIEYSEPLVRLAVQPIEGIDEPLNIEPQTKDIKLAVEPLVEPVEVLPEPAVNIAIAPLIDADDQEVDAAAVPEPDEESVVDSSDNEVDVGAENRRPRRRFGRGRRNPRFNSRRRLARSGYYYDWNQAPNYWPSWGYPQSYGWNGAYNPWGSVGLPRPVVPQVLPVLPSRRGLRRAQAAVIPAAEDIAPEIVTEVA